MSSKKKYWKNVEELENTSMAQKLKQNEFPEHIPVNDFLGDKETLEESTTNRRDFLKYVGFSTAAATLAACEGPVVKAIPYVVQPEQIVPGVANYYATTIADGFDFTSVLVKTREGRPIKIENNELAGSDGVANARVHASVLSLYDNTRLKAPQVASKTVTWKEFDAKFLEKLARIRTEVVLLTSTFSSPSTSQLIKDFTKKNPNLKHIEYDAYSNTEALDAYEKVYGERALANYDFSKADAIVGVGADFLGDWQGGGYDLGYSKNKVPQNGKMSKHIQFESNMTITGANADERFVATPTEQKKIVAAIYAGLFGGAKVSLSSKLSGAVKKAIAQLKSKGKKALFVTGLNDVNAQLLALAINTKLRSEALNTASPKLTSVGDTKKVDQLVKRMQSGKVGALIMVGVNPLYTYANADAFEKALDKVALKATFSTHLDATASKVEFVGALPHYLESWGDVEFNKGKYGLMQPTIRPLFDTRQFQDFLLTSVGATTTYDAYLKDFWNQEILKGLSFNKALHDGVYEINNQAAASANLAVVNNTVISALANAKPSSGLELILYTKTSLGVGAQASNPWLQEFPDPITRVSWDNYLTISKSDASDLGLENYNVANGALNGSYVNITVGNSTVENVPVYIQPGQAKGTVGLSLGYGRDLGGKEEMNVGVNAFPLYKNANNVQSSVKIEKAEGIHEFACVQLQKTLMGRGDIIKETTLEIFNTKDKKKFNTTPVVSLDHQVTPVTSPDVDIWDEFDRSIAHHFNLSIDLNSCTGCGACVIACHAENNVPVVGKSEVRRSRDMHWLRIDRYYSSEETFEQDNEKKEGFAGLGESLSGFGKMEDPSENPQVAFQPVMCQHCNHAPCETVCPVAATSHGRQGQNHMAYNRCVGTRYCANNCPYKVRRFNWFLYNNNDEFDFHMNNDLGRMVVNPDVTVRSRGVMEKCSMCIQLTQATILEAKKEGKKLSGDDFDTACSRACATGAMSFGDINDPESSVAKSLKSDRMYHLLEHVGTKPNVQYQVKVRNV